MSNGDRAAELPWSELGGRCGASSPSWTRGRVRPRPGFRPGRRVPPRAHPCLLWARARSPAPCPRPSRMVGEPAGVRRTLWLAGRPDILLAVGADVTTGPFESYRLTRGGVLWRANATGLRP